MFCLFRVFICTIDFGKPSILFEDVRFHRVIEKCSKYKWPNRSISLIIMDLKNNVKEFYFQGSLIIDFPHSESTDDKRTQSKVI